LLVFEVKVVKANCTPVIPLGPGLLRERLAYMLQSPACIGDTEESCVSFERMYWSGTVTDVVVLSADAVGTPTAIASAVAAPAANVAARAGRRIFMMVLFQVLASPSRLGLLMVCRRPCRGGRCRHIAGGPEVRLTRGHASSER
jgi:hypothetical protein